MVKVKDNLHILDDGNIDVDDWLSHLAEEHSYLDSRLINHACILSQLAGDQKATESGESCLQSGLAIAEILVDLELDPAAISAAIIYESYQQADLTLDDIEEQLGKEVAKLVNGVERMSEIDIVRTQGKQLSHIQSDNIRKLLIAMIDDVRIVLIKLAERLRVLRTISHMPERMKQHIAQEVMDIYAPLANRLGVGQIKWEMEDLAFRYLDTEKYKEIANGLKTRRVERDKYVENIVADLEDKMKEHAILNAEVYGRSKHIHSIYKKMSRKKVDISQIYDATAVRVLVSSVDDCYRVLSVVHNAWTPIPEEFDDYISNIKPNGYQSLHTAVIGPQERVFEVQVRTHEMHEQAELGVAAHWRYKEGVTGNKASHERKIEWLREVLAWQHEVSGEQAEEKALEDAFVEDRIYVFTPESDVIDLAKGATPLDFAYTIHTNVGHRCRGAKVGGAIVPLTHELKTGDQVEILTAKEPKPSRDWINPHSGYLKSSRAKAKVLHWLKQQDYDQNLEDGKDMLEREVKKLHIDMPDVNAIAKQLNFKKGDDLLAAVGRGDARMAQIIGRVQTESAQKSERAIPVVAREDKNKNASDIDIQGVDNLMTSLAKCCRPLPGDSVIGYITRDKGINIHRDDCANVAYAHENNHERLIEVKWGKEVTHNYPTDILIKAYDRSDLMHELTALLANEKTAIRALNTEAAKEDRIRNIRISLDVENMSALSRLLDKIRQIPNIIEANRITQ